MAAARKRNRVREEREVLAELAKPKGDGIASAKGQLRTAAKATAVILGVLWVLAIGFWSGLDTRVPVYVALGLTAAVGVASLLIVRNLKRSEQLGALLSGDDKLSPEQRTQQLAELETRVEKGDAGAILAKAQLLMQESPKEALQVLEKVDLEKANKLIALQVRATRAMIHLNLGEVKAARELADGVDLAKAPDPKTRGTLSAVVAEAWARSGNPIEANELLDKYDPEDKDFEDAKMQLLRARVFACAHKQDLNGMRRALKALVEVSPQLAAMFVGQKRIHPLLEKEARRMLEKSGLVPRQKMSRMRG
jgi:hypothetical protein